MKENKQYHERPTFELGLVMAGAISAGAYTSGVLDFLFEALQALEDEKEKPDSKLCPPYDVKIKVMSGASAGGMCAAIATGALVSGVRFGCTSGQQRPNPLFNSWVNKIDMSELLQVNDLQEPNSPVKSILDSTVLKTIANDVLDIRQFTPVPKYVSNELHLILTLTNTRGVPYDVSFDSLASGAGYEMLNHADHFYFIVNPLDKDKKSAYPIPLSLVPPQDANWDKLKLAALATGAFPIGLAARLVTRPAGDYLTWINFKRKVYLNEIDHLDIPVISPSWKLSEAAQYDFLSIDGGVMNNEPLELCRRILAGKSGHNPRDAKDVIRSLIMIDPFPSVSWENNYNVQESKVDIIDIALQMFSSLLEQARFKPDELRLAYDEKVFSRFLISPTQQLASASLGSFGGFLSKNFREHDFYLGRLNCQKFLKDHFALPIAAAKENPIFKHWSQENWKVWENENPEKKFIPIIPLYGSAKNSLLNCKKLEWPSITPQAIRTLKAQIQKRLAVVVEHLIDTRLPKDFQWLAKLFWYIGKNTVLRKVMLAIQINLIKAGLM
jgi:hypothetical protein